MDYNLIFELPFYPDDPDSNHPDEYATAKSEIAKVIVDNEIKFHPYLERLVDLGEKAQTGSDHINSLKRIGITHQIRRPGALNHPFYTQNKRLRMKYNARSLS